MSIIKIITCDCCGKEESQNPHWTRSYGQAILSLKNLPNIQKDYSLQHVCPECGEEIKKAIIKIITKPELLKEK